MIENGIIKHHIVVYGWFKALSLLSIMIQIRCYMIYATYQPLVMALIFDQLSNSPAHVLDLVSGLSIEGEAQSLQKQASLSVRGSRCLNEDVAPRHHFCGIHLSVLD